MTIQTGKAPVAPAAPAPAPKRAGGLRADGAWRVLPAREVEGGFYITYPADDDVLARIVKGDVPEAGEVKYRRVYEGQIATDIPAVSLQSLLTGADGKPFICKADGPDDPYRKVTGASGDAPKGGG